MTRLTNLDAGGAAALSGSMPAAQNVSLGERIGGIETDLDTVKGVAAGEVQLDGTFVINNTTDPTKQAAFDVSGVATGTKRTLKIPNTAGTILTTAAAATMSTPADPTGTTSTAAYVMMGLAGSITPLQSTRVQVTISGQMANSTINDGVNIQLAYGTGAAPANAAAVTGTAVGAAQIATSLVAAQRSGFSISGIITGLTIGTAIWIDAQLKAITGGTASIFGVTISAIEI